LGVGAIVVREGKMLLVRRGRPPHRGTWAPPGGHVEHGETIAAAIERELLEETGLVGRCGVLVGWVERFGADHHVVVLDFLVEIVGGELRAGDDAAEAAWVLLTELDDRDDLVPGLLAFLREHEIVPAVSDPATPAGASPRTL
jgi:ADP-ribose pyrophosphatase YjhB (NUDIX family)